MSPRPKIALNMNEILLAATDIADEAGLHEVTLATLAKKLSIRPPSLYNHFDGLPHLRKLMAIYGIENLYAALADCMGSESGDQDIMELSKAYVLFARKHPGLYEATLAAPDPADHEVQLAGKKIVDLALSVLQSYSLSEEASLHAVRGLRSILHGFSTLEQNRGFGLALNTDKSLELIIKAFLAGIKEMNT
ncbi:MAG: TetR-like C-terminal domain-containing protein [Bacillota bacterium]|nr:TetR-like C-terminal domain-containing protein [Bacillota bacterium]